ncbi:MAG: type II 3-dehydroquinate dehydratase [Pseudomonadota bacterium]|nr:type II 3-dehydroquinate dehydratase [Pseudomonadota bacterium]
MLAIITLTNKDLDIKTELRHNLKMTRISVIHGPNLHLLGKRQPEIYGSQNLEAVNTDLKERAAEYGLSVTFMQSNSESEIINYISEISDSIDFLIFNPAAFSHTSIAIYDTLLATKLKFIEVHISNINRREEFRQYSHFSKIALGTITGFGTYSYILALDAIRKSIMKADQDN